jgi:hypothetical protein
MLLHAVVVVAASAVTIAGGTALARYWDRTIKQRRDNDVLSTYVAVIGTLYAVLLAFVLLSVWEQFDTARAAAEREASQMADLTRLTDGLPEPSATRVRAALREFSTAVVEEWPTMADRARSDRTDRALDKVWRVLIETEPASGRGTSIYDQALERLRSASDSRQDRLSQAHPSVQPVIWILLIGGGVLTLVSTYFFETTAHAYQPVNVGLTLMIAFILYLVYVFDRPFTGDIATQPTAMQAVVEMLHRKS